MIAKGKKEIRVLHLNTAKSWRGGERQVLLLARSCEEKKIGQQLVVCPPGSPLQKKCAEYSIPCMTLPMAGELDLSAVWNLKIIVENFQANIVHAHTARAHGIAVVLKFFLPHIQLVVSRRVDFHIAKNIFSKYKYISRKVNHYIAISKNVKKILLEDGIEENRIDIAYSGLDLERFKKLPGKKRLVKEFGIASNELVFGNIAALVDHKDQRTLIEAVNILKKIRKKYPFRVFIVGDGELKSQLVELADRYDLLKDNTLTFTGFRSDVDEFLSLFDIFVMSSKEEGLGTSVLDAMAAGLPVCATSGGGIPEMIDDGKGGFLSPVGDAVHLASAMEKVLKSSALRNKMASYNKIKVKDFSRQSTCKQTLEIYKKVLKNEI